MSSTDQNDATTRRAVHAFINADGSFVDDQELATGIYYKDRATGREFTYQIPDAVAGSVQTMLAIFGSKTLATNTASAARQAGLADEIAAITSRFMDDLKDGQWNSPADRQGGPRIDVEKAIEAIESVLDAEGKDSSGVRARAESEDASAYPGKPIGLEYLRGALKNDKVQAAYNKLRGKEAPKTDDLV